MESALGHVRLLEECGFDDICISVKCSRVPVNMAAYELLPRTGRTIRCIWASPRPAHRRMGVLKSAMGIGGPAVSGHRRHACG